MWKAIDFNPRFLVSDTGEVYDTERKTIKKNSLGNNGYYYTNINAHPYTIHRLVATAFIPNPENKTNFL